MMFKGKTSLLALLTVSGMMLSACGPDAATPTAIPAPTNTAAPAAATDTTAPAAATDTTAPATTAPATTAPATTAPLAAGGKIAILLPETKTARYESQDLPNFKAKLTALGFDVNTNLIYSNANQDASAQKSQAEAALTNGAKVLVLDPVDSDAASAIADEAKAKG
ncbi:MAG: substrate-binding domain-containing protein, partial [Chloroflexota bacterium]|nr:substrate-binding domain-containing protein [Chloroflexota bacterium]